MFINTGTLMKAKSSSEIIGVIAHETGHIAGGHTIIFSDQMESALKTSILTTLLGVAAGVATGNSDLGMAFALGGQGTAQRQVLAFSRGQEASADQFALKALEETKQSAKGLYNFFDQIFGQELLISERQDPYVRTHPLTRNRMITIQSHIEKSKFSNKVSPEYLETKHKRMVAKLFSFLKPQIKTLQKYPIENNSIEARYARSIAFYRRGQLNKAIPIIDTLIDENPEDGYFWELKGQMLFENGNIPEAIKAYSEARDLMPFEPLILIALAHAMVESSEKKYVNKTQEILNVALQKDPYNIFAWDLSAKSYAINEQDGLSSYAAAERALLTGQVEEVIRYIKKAEKIIRSGTPIWLRLQDIKQVVKQILDERSKKRKRI